ncbi:MAG: polysaccharide biosynthesis C-terminal domain-containing protein [Flavobacteriales bacterium]|jgi:O-antigen/teichoic acid export membrane protein
MGIIANQASRNAALILLGVVFGAINNLFILPNAFEDFKEGWAFLGLALSIGIISSQLFSFSSQSIFINRIPKLENEQQQNDLVSLVLAASLLGAIVFGGGYYIFQDFILSRLSESNAILVEKYYSSILVITVALIAFNSFSGFVIAKFKTVQLTVVQDSFTKISYLVIALFYLFKLISFTTVVWLFVGSYIFIALIMFIQALKNGLKLGIASRTENIKQVWDYALFSILDKGASVIMQRLDTIMIVFILDLEFAADYLLAFFIGSVVYIPFKAMLSIVPVIVSKEIGLGNFRKLESIYKRTTLYGLILGGFIFIGIWTNVDSLLLMLPVKFRTGTWVILFIGLSKIFQIFAGMSGSYIVYSEYYRYNLRLNLVLLGLSVFTNFIGIWRYGINGAAAATALSILIYSVMKLSFVYRKFQCHPFSKELLKLLFFQLVCTALFMTIPAFEAQPWIQIIIKSVIFTAVYYLGVRLLKIAPELNSLSSLKESLNPIK